MILLQNNDSSYTELSYTLFITREILSNGWYQIFSNPKMYHKNVCPVVDLTVRIDGIHFRLFSNSNINDYTYCTRD